MEAPSLPITPLLAQWRRLYLAPEGGWVRALVLGLARPAEWAPLASVWAAVQDELGWPEPGIAVDGEQAYQLWFSLEQAVAPPEAMALLQALCARHLHTVAPERLRLLLGADPGDGAGQALLPPRKRGPERWSAFVARDLAPVFGDSPCLDIAPGEQHQADLLARLRPVRPDEWQAAWQALRTAAPAAAVATSPTLTPPSHDALSAREAARAFLLLVMNDSGLPMPQRIEAARALLGERG
jgi:hypothetical protein